jgi:hypothetical protein
MATTQTLVLTISQLPVDKIPVSAVVTLSGPVSTVQTVPLSTDPLEVTFADLTAGDYTVTVQTVDADNVVVSNEGAPYPDAMTTFSLAAPVLGGVVVSVAVKTA